MILNSEKSKSARTRFSAKPIERKSRRFGVDLYCYNIWIDIGDFDNLTVVHRKGFSTQQNPDTTKQPASDEVVRAGLIPKRVQVHLRYTSIKEAQSACVCKACMQQFLLV